MPGVSVSAISRVIAPLDRELSEQPVGPPPGIGTHPGVTSCTNGRGIGNARRERIGRVIDAVNRRAAPDLFACDGRENRLDHGIFLSGRKPRIAAPGELIGIALHDCEPIHKR